MAHLKWLIVRKMKVVVTLLCALPLLNRQLCYFQAITWPSYTRTYKFSKMANNSHYWLITREHKVVWTWFRALPPLTMQLCIFWTWARSAYSKNSSSKKWPILANLKWPILRKRKVVRTSFCSLPPLTRRLCFFWAIPWPSYSKISDFGKNGPLWPLLANYERTQGRMNFILCSTPTN